MSPRYHAERHPTAASHKLAAARDLARLQLRQVGAAVGVHPRTVRRWELGETTPTSEQWAHLAAYYAAFVPEAAEQLARAARVPSPIAVPPAVDDRAIEEALFRAADQLDVSPRRVRAAVRFLVTAVTNANGTLPDLAKAAQEREQGGPERSIDPGG
jgi:transcriptional regulator with XRE-family HTH domain